MTEGRRTLLAGIVLVLFAGGLRWATLPSAPVPLGDERYYRHVAQSIAAGEGHRFQVNRAWRPPLHPWLLAPHVVPDALETTTRRMLGQQLIWGTLVVLLTTLLAHELVGPRAAWIAGGLAAVHPELIAFSHTLWSENLFTLLLGLGLWSLLRLRAGGSGRAVATGAAFGLAALTREVALPVVLVLLVWLVAVAPTSARRRRIREALLCALTVVAVVTPWTVRNARVLGRLVPVSTVGWFALAEGNTLEDDWRAAGGPRQEFFRQSYFAEKNEADRIDLARTWAWREIREQQPRWGLKKLGRTVAALLSPDSYLFLKISRGGYADMPTPVVRALMIVVGLGLVGSLLGAAVGIAATPRPRRWFGLLPLLLVIALHVLANVATRFRVPWTPLLLVYASAWLAHPSLLRRLSWRFWVGLGVTALVVAWVVAPAVASNLAVLWQKGASAGTAYVPR